MRIESDRLYTAEGVRELDRRAIEDHGIRGYDLMVRAGRAAFRLLRLRWPRARRIAVYCGGGNNGGDGLVVARLAREAGFTVDLALAGDPDRLKGAAGEAWRAWVDAGGASAALDAIDPAEADVIVDALLGTGLDRPVRGAIGTAIEAINGVAVPVLALDIPSGLQADTGAVMGIAVRAQATVTFIGHKRGLFTAAGPDWTGAVFSDDLDVPAAIYADEDPAIEVIGRDTVARMLPRHRPAAHKGDRGRVLVVGGDCGYAGAVRLAAEAALRAGAGLITVATRAAHAPALAAARPELMARGVEDPASELPALIEAADVVVAGPGLGAGDWGRAALAAIRQAAPERLLLDADALNIAAAEPGKAPTPTIITPHPGEAGRLLGMETGAVQADRFAALEGLLDRYGCTVVLKGAGTLVGTAGQGTALLPGARPELGVGGTGDVLSGLIAGLLSQGLSGHDAACTGVWLHAAAVMRTRDLSAGPPLPSELAENVAAMATHLTGRGRHGARWDRGWRIEA
ncbi:bifunctional ADP-dependent NAD(P)H-hydrate dehydratase/NAD(P)H-hydrate epimerase [Halofilum ochraceum]|uniref:bifunctional ADP-dependent NAD(P)H-hydrate dehydratase/NAD(P)H-hydrate epimerase n=1 Tax=Halofilum ochraceum TaxID=1611323 RepID=UPI0008D92EF7|nr:bifunctional ADP-dependent NAD(P)H-hydrate dehydratase/NAD(P)H-hydrate epimerase [Halofilum ochraceum]